MKKCFENMIKRKSNYIFQPLIATISYLKTMLLTKPKIKNGLETDQQDE